MPTPFGGCGGRGEDDDVPVLSCYEDDAATTLRLLACVRHSVDLLFFDADQRRRKTTVSEADDLCPSVDLLLFDYD